jgi:hypothetical protein
MGQWMRPSAQAVAAGAAGLDVESGGAGGATWGGDNEWDVSNCDRYCRTCRAGDSSRPLLSSTSATFVGEMFCVQIVTKYDSSILLHAVTPPRSCYTTQRFPQKVLTLS